MSSSMVGKLTLLICFMWGQVCTFQVFLPLARVRSLATPVGVLWFLLWRMANCTCNPAIAWHMTEDFAVVPGSLPRILVAGALVILGCLHSTSVIPAPERQLAH